MAKERGSENPKKAEKLQKRKEIEEAWLQLDDRELELQEEVDFLIAKRDTASAEEKNSLKKLQAEIDGIHHEKWELQSLWGTVSPFPMDFIGIRNRVRKLRQEYMLDSAAGSGTKEKLGALRDEFMDYFDDDSKLALAAQRLYEFELLPQDLKGGPNLIPAVRAVFSGALAKDFIARLQSPDSPEYAAAVQELSSFADLLKSYYDQLASFKTGAEKLTEGVVVGRLGKAVKEIGKNPTSLAIAAAALLATIVGVTVGWGKLSKGQKNWTLGLLLGGTALGGASILSDKYGYTNIGLGDWLEDIVGMRSDAALTPAELDKVRKVVEKQIPAKDKNSIDDFIRIMDGKSADVMDSFLDALRANKNEMDLSVLLGKGIDAKEERAMDAGSLFTAIKWFSIDCYKQAFLAGEVAEASDEKSKALLGAEWAKKTMGSHDMGSVVIALGAYDMSGGVEGRGAAGGAVRRAPETAAMDRNLSELARRAPMLKDNLKATERSDVYLIRGYPVKYNFNDRGDHEFTGNIVADTDTGTVPAAIATFTMGKSLEGDDLDNTVARLLSEKEAQVIRYLKKQYSAVNAPMQYNVATGSYEYDPPLKRTALAGLPNYKKDESVPLVFRAKTDRFVLDLDVDSDGMPDGHLVTYSKVDDARKAYELEQVLKERVTQDTKSTLLGLGFTVTNYTDTAAAGSAAANTTVTILYGGGHTGTLIYENDALKSFTLAQDAELERAWRTVAASKVDEFFRREDVQEELLKATGHFTINSFGGWMDKIGSLLGDGWEAITDDQIEARFHDDWEAQVIKNMRAKKRDMVEDYMTSVFGYAAGGVTYTGKPEETLLKDESTFFDTKLTEVQTGVSATIVKHEKGPDYELEWTEVDEIVNTQGREAIETALSPLRYQTPAAAPSLFLSAVRGVKNTFVADAVRDHEYNERVKVYLGELARDVHGLATPPNKPGRQAVDGKIEAIAHKAQGEALKYWNESDQEAIINMMLEPIDGTYKAEWTEATTLVATYMANSLKWENYGFLPNPENMAEIMKLWYKGIENGNATDNSSAGPNPTDALKYAKYFIWEVYLRMGGHREKYTLDFDEEVQAVSDTNYQYHIAGLQSAVRDYKTWQASPITPGFVPGMETTTEVYRQWFEKYKQEAHDKFMEWFKEKRDTGGALEVDWNWPDIFRDHVETRLWQIIGDPNVTDAIQLTDALNEFARYVSAEKGIYEMIITSNILSDYHFSRDHIDPIFRNCWNAAPRTPVKAYSEQIFDDLAGIGWGKQEYDLNGYTARVKQLFDKGLSFIL